MSSQPYKIQTNLDNVLSYLRRCADEGIQLAVFPECVLTGYDLTLEEARQVAISDTDDTLLQIQEACKQHGLTIQIGALERTQDHQLFNSAFLISPEGLISNYRKTHLPVLGLDRFVTPGLQPPKTVETPLGRLGSLICFDLRFPEPVRQLALAGTQLLLVSTAWPRAASLYADFLARARAAENRIFVLAANRCSRERSAHFLGRSLIIDPDGNVLQEADTASESILSAEIDPGQADRKHLIFEPGTYELDLFGARRPDLYQALTD
jgi:predicted amidohydrolase